MEGKIMYQFRHTDEGFENFILPFGGKLKSSNRWVILGKSIPWGEFEESYSKEFKKFNKRGRKPITLRVALGSLIIQEKLGFSDKETVEHITENPYLQHFLGYESYLTEEPFDSSMFVHFRKRLAKNILTEVNEAIAKRATGIIEKNEKDKDDTDSNKGILKVAATCAPSDIKYPTDLNLLNEAREKLEGVIDTLCENTEIIKPRTYRKKARKVYLSTAKKRNVIRNQMRKTIGKQQRFVRRNLKSIEKLTKVVSLTKLSRRQYKDLLVVSELYSQQDLMYRNRVHVVEDRIVSISQPDIRPIVRGKSKAKTEFGAKVSVSVVDGFTYLDRFSFDSYNEALDLKEQLESYRKRFGFYPEAVQCDKIYRNRENINYCKNLNIRISGPILGRPKTENTQNAIELKKIRQIIKQDAIERIEVERKFGLAKRRYSLGLVMEKLPQTVFAAVSLTILVMNLDKILRWILSSLLCLLDYGLFQIRLILKGMLNGYFIGNIYCQLRPISAITG
jgi:hypothetical protein